MARIVKGCCECTAPIFTNGAGCDGKQETEC
jgi:hypothetical protein